MSPQGQRGDCTSEQTSEDCGVLRDSCMASGPRTTQWPAAVTGCGTCLYPSMLHPAEFTGTRMLFLRKSIVFHHGIFGLLSRQLAGRLRLGILLHMDPMGLALNPRIPPRPDLQEEGGEEGPQRTGHYVSHSSCVWLVLLCLVTTQGLAAWGFPPPSLGIQEHRVSIKHGCGRFPVASHSGLIVLVAEPHVFPGLCEETGSRGQGACWRVAASGSALGGAGREGQSGRARAAGHCPTSRFSRYREPGSALCL